MGKNKLDKIAISLKKEYGDFNHYNKMNPLDELVFIICSIKRNEKICLLMFRALKNEFPSYEKMLKASQRKLSKVLSPYGLQNEKSFAIKEILRSITKSFGKPTLNPLKKMDDIECESFLVHLRGVGKKVARCVMLYSLGREVFPVDSNCWRSCDRLGIIDWRHGKSLSPKDMDLLQSKIPARLRYSLHVNFVAHGRKICLSKNPKCHLCVIKKYCSDLRKCEIKNSFRRNSRKEF